MNLHVAVGPSALFYPELASWEVFFDVMETSVRPVSLGWLTASQVYLDGIFESHDACVESLLVGIHAESGGRHDPLLVIPKLGDGVGSTPVANLAKRIVASQLVEALHLHAFIAPIGTSNLETNSQHKLAEACLDRAQANLGDSLKKVSSVATHFHLLDPTVLSHQPLWRNVLSEEFVSHTAIVFSEQPVQIDREKLKGAFSRLLREWDETGLALKAGVAEDEIVHWAQKSTEVVLGRNYRSY